MIGAKSFGEKFARRLREMAEAQRAHATAPPQPGEPPTKDPRVVAMLYTIAATLDVLAGVVIEVTA